VHAVIKPRSNLIGNGLFDPHFDDETAFEKRVSGEAILPA
jgi:hypothetical protein